MRIQEEDFSIEIIPETHTVILEGTMRLSSPLAYDNYFNDIITLVKTSKEVTLDIRKLEFLNSSGLTSLGRIFIQAKAAGTTGKLLASNAIPWHTRSVSSIAKLWPGLVIEMN